MPTDLLGNIPSGADVFLDANIFIYAIGGVSPQCQTLLDRCARRDVFGITSYEAVHEVTHRLMVSEAYKKGLITKPRADLLRDKPAVIRTLTDYWVQVSALLRLALTFLLRTIRLSNVRTEREPHTDL